VADAVGEALEGAVWGGVHQAVAGVVEGIVEKTVFESDHPAPQDFLRVVGCDPMNNTKAYYAVDRDVSWAVFGAVGRALSGDVRWAVHRAVDVAVDWAVVRAVWRAVVGASNTDSPHPGLQDFLEKAL
jgi:hypothetical protein